MPIASLASLHWYGPAAGAAVIGASASSTAGVKGYAGANGTVSGVASVPLAKATRLVNAPATVTGLGSVAAAQPRGRTKIAATVKVNALSQDDVTGAVLEAQVLPGLTLRQALVDARAAAKLAAALSA